VIAMTVKSLSANSRTASLGRLTRKLQQSRTAEETLRALQRGFAEVGGFVASILLSTRGLPDGHYRVARLQLTDEPGDELFDGQHEESHFSASTGVLGPILAQHEPQLIQDMDWSQDPVFHEILEGYSSVIALPLAGNRLPMDWAILLKKSPQRFSVMEFEEAVERAALVTPLLENQIRAGELALAHHQADCEARQVGELQRALLPALPPPSCGLEIAASYEPSGRAGGDLYDFFPLEDRHSDPGDAKSRPSRWCIFMGDIAGHGLAAAVVMAIVQAVLHARPAGIATPESLLIHANRQLCAKGLGGFVTAFIGVYEPTLRRLTYANAGHPPPLVRRFSDGSIRPLGEAANYPLGIDDAETFNQAIVQLEKDDMILLYTDGITEARAADSDLFESDRLNRVVSDGGNRPAELIERLRTAVRVHEQGEAARDDQTMLAARVL
jgi:sigma-B regulation protein RsbU (phosphoserine phosphatase)